MNGNRDGKDPEILFEFTQIGQYMRVAAIDSATLVEVVVSGPVTASQYHLQLLAQNKLKRRLEQMRNQGAIR